MSRSDPSPDDYPVQKADAAVYQAVADVLQDQAERAIARTQAPAPTAAGGGPLVWAALVLLTTLSAYLWIAPPGWLAGPAALPPPLELVEAGRRMEVYLQALNVEDFLEREGRLPNSLAEAGDPFSEVTYQRLDADGYRLTLAWEEDSLSYQSGEPLEGFLGNAVEIIRGREG